MSIFIQHSITGEFCAANGRWTKSLEKAVRFDQLLRAWEEIAERRLSGVDIMMRGKDGEQQAMTSIGAV
jgi:hypothetical protein